VIHILFIVLAVAERDELYFNSRLPDAVVDRLVPIANLLPVSVVSETVNQQNPDGSRETPFRR
jgi:hypothetical protein